MWRVRIDDLDPHRARPGIADRILYQLEALGLYWDGAVVFQQGRTALYQEGLDQLSKDGHIYGCRCSRVEIGQGLYSGCCRERGLPVGAEGLSLRIRVAPEMISLVDRVHGHYHQRLDQSVGDFVLFRRDGVHAYHLATVLDDAEMGITHVVRGSDLLESTPRQIYLQNLLALATPIYAHTPLLVDGDGRKLSKSQLPEETTAAGAKATLLRLLALLGLVPPADVKQSARDEILTWAQLNWEMERLKGPHQIEVQYSEVN